MSLTSEQEYNGMMNAQAEQEQAQADAAAAAAQLSAAEEEAAQEIAENALTDQERFERDMQSAANDVDMNKVRALSQSSPQLATKDLTPEEKAKQAEEFAKVQAEMNREMTPEEEEAAGKEFLEDVENKKWALNLATQINEITKGKWFTTEWLSQKTRQKHNDTVQRVHLAKMFGHVLMRIGNWQDGPEKANTPLFKVAISKEMQIIGIDEVIQYHKDQIKSFELQKKALG